MSGMLLVTMPGIAHEETGLGRSNSRRENGKPLYFTATRFAGETRRWNCGAEELGSRESPAPPTALKVLLDKAGAEVNVELDEWGITNHLKTVDLTSLDDKNVSSAALEGLAAYRPHSTAFTNELDLVIRMPVRTRPRSGLTVEQEHRNSGVALLSSDKLM
jgi:hypothetical protein